MISLCNSNIVFPKPHNKSHNLNLPFKFKTQLSLPHKPSSPYHHHHALRQCLIKSCAAADQAAAASAATTEIDMIRTKEGIYAAKPQKVVVLWDLDNKPPRGPPYEAAMALKKVAQRFGEVVDISAYANRHAFIHLPRWVIGERRERRRSDILERKGVTTPSQPYVCGVCGRKCKTNLDLKKHFRQLHERERQKKLNRLKSLKGKKRQRFKERFINGNQKYQEAAKKLITPRVGYGLAAELRRAGVYVKTVEDKPQAADWAVKRQMRHSMSRGVDWLVLVSDDSDFREMLRRAREANLGTLVVGDWDRALGRHADLWVPWVNVENGEVTEKDLVPRTMVDDEFVDEGNGQFSVTHFDGGFSGEGDLDSVLDELVGMRSKFNELRISGFSDGGEEEDKWARVGTACGDFDNDSDEEGDFFLESEDESEEDDDYF